LFRLTGQATALELVLPGIKQRIAGSGFEVRHELVELDRSRLLVIVGKK
jgi:glyceraldehyde-3-phosphate dehydrogenase/erythrose-4-phosphate dehydrogenase